MANVHFRKCGHNRVLGALENCDQCIASARERAIAKAGLSDKQRAVIQLAKETVAKTMESYLDLAISNPSPATHDAYGVPWPFTLDTPFGSDPSDEIGLLGANRVECNHVGYGRAKAEDWRLGISSTYFNACTVVFLPCTAGQSTVEEVGIYRGGAIRGSLTLSNGPFVVYPGTQAWFAVGALSIPHGPAKPKAETAVKALSTGCSCSGPNMSSPKCAVHGIGGSGERVSDCVMDGTPSVPKL